ncbi:hypothetical protein ABT352_09240 [Streptosporangium sp. NPDC000563]|uniref:hypothetical protein n=1 Tax=Streptosporangium sp. NPDC000563 TaxID=3154366 RepID=UPI003333DC85
MKTLPRKLVAAAFAAVLLTACSAEQPTVSYHVDYPAYQSAAELYKKALLVVEVRLGDTARTVLEKGIPDSQNTDPLSNPNADAPKAGTEAAPQEEPLVTTVYPAQVVKVFKGEAKPGETIEVKELGGTLNGTKYEEAGASSLQRSRTYVLFLETYPNSPAALLNSEQGKYPIDAAGNLESLRENTIKLTRSDLEKLSTGN